MVKMKRKLAAGGEDKRAQEASGASPVKLASIGCVPLPGASPLLDSVVAEMEAAATYYLQLSVLQRLKAQLLANIDSCSTSAAAAGASSLSDATAMSPAELGTILDWLLALYLHPASRPLRKTLTAVVAAAELRSKSIQGAAADAGLASACATAALSSYCDRLSVQASSDADTRGSWSVGGTSAEVATLLAVLELPLLSTPLFEATSGAVKGLLTCLAAHLTHHLQAVLAAAPSGSGVRVTAAAPTSVKRDRDGNAIASVHAAEALASVECCGFVLTGVIALISARGGKAWNPTSLLDATTTKSKATAAQHQDAWRQLVDGCLALLERCGVVPKDQLTQAALALVLLSKPLWAAADLATSSSSMEQDDNATELSSRAEAIARTFGGLFEDDTDNTKGQRVAAATAVSDAKPSKQLLSSASSSAGGVGAMVVASLQARCSDGRLPPLARLALLRGIAHGVDLAVLLQPPLRAGEGEGSGLLCGCLFRAVAEKCSDANTLVQVYAFQVLEALLGRLATALSSQASSTPHHHDGGEQMRGLLPKASVVAALVKDTLELTLRFWEQPAKPLARVLPTVFTRVVELSAFTTTTTTGTSLHDHNTEGEEVSKGTEPPPIPWWSPLLRRLRDQPPTRKGKYAALAVLVPHIVKASVASAALTTSGSSSSSTCTSDDAMSKALGVHAQALTASQVVRDLLEELLPSALVAATALRAGEANATAGAAQLLSLLLHSLKQHHREARVALPGGSANGGNASGTSSRRGRGGKNPRATATTQANNTHASGAGAAHNNGKDKEDANSALIKEATLAVDVAEATGRGIWAQQLCQLLLLSPQAMAARGVEHLLGEALTADPDAAPTLLAEIARLSLASNVSSERLLWARVHVVRLARLNGARNAHSLIVYESEGAASKSDKAEDEEGRGTEGLSLNALASGMMHFSSDLRLSALEVVAAATKTKSFPPQHELDAFMHALPYSLNCGGADQRHRVMRLVQRLVVRARDTGRGLEVNVSSKDEDKEGSVTATAAGGGATSEKDDEEEDERVRINTFVRWLITTLLKQLYPGAPFSRELLALELLHLLATEVLDNAGWSEAHTKTLPKPASKQEASKKKQTSNAELAPSSSPPVVVVKWSVAKVLQEELWDSSAACRSLLPLLLSSWDRSRSLTKQLLTRFSLPLPGINLLPQRGLLASSSSPSSSASLLGDALTLCGSPRQTEADAGALALHLVFQTAVLGSGQRLNLLALNSKSTPQSSSHAMDLAEEPAASISLQAGESDSSGAAGGGSSSSVESAAYLFLHDLCALSEQRLGALVPIFASVHAGVSHASHAPAVGDFKGRAVENQHSVLASTSAGTPAASGAAAAAVDDDESAPSPPAVTLELVNGLLVALKLCVASSAPLVAKLMAEAQARQHTAAAGAATDQGKEQAEAAAAEAAAVVVKWCALLERCVAAAVRALKVAMVVVADAGFDTNNDGVNDSTLSGGGGEVGDEGACLQSFTNPAAKTRENTKAKGSSSAESSTLTSSAMAVNAANGAQGITSSNSGDGATANSYGEDAGAAARGGGKEAKGDAAFMLFQAAVVGGWQMAREACGCLAALVQAMPLPTQEDTHYDEGSGTGGKRVRLPSSVLKVATVRAVGDALLDALQRLRHTGAIVAAQAGFQSLCRSLLAPTSARGTTSSFASSHNGSGGAARALRALPSEWAKSVVLRLEASGGDGLYVLRRSASFGYSFLSIARADPGLGSSGGSSDSSASSAGSSSSGGGGTVGGGSSSGNSGGGTVLPFILEKLLGCAEATTSTSHSTEYRVGVHALNVLRLLFADAQVGESVSIEVPRGLRCAVRGFKHEQWAVRNSAMMLFTALVQRSIANAKNHAASGSGAEAALKRANVPLLPPLSMNTAAAAAAATSSLIENNIITSAPVDSSSSSGHGGGGGGDRGSTAAGFFHRFPSLAPFMLSELEDATSSSTATGDHHQTLHPSLVPLLLLLSRLRPSVESAETNSLVLIAPTPPTSSGASNSHSGSASATTSKQLEAVPLPVFLSQLLRLVLRCRSQRFHAARTMAARAAAVLCPVDLAAQLATSLCHSLPVGGNQHQVPHEHENFDAATKVEECPKSVNAMHGTLLLVKELVATGLTHLASQHTSIPASHSASTVPAAAASSMADDDNDESTTSATGAATAADASDTATTAATLSLLSALSSRVVPLLTHVNCPPPLRLVALEVLQVAGAFQHSFPPFGITRTNMVQDWANTTLPFCLATAASDLLLNLPRPPQGASTSTPALATSTAQAVPLESVAAPWLSLLRAALARSAVFACFQPSQPSRPPSQEDEKKQDILRLLLLSDDHDVRCAAIKGVKKVMQHLPSSPSSSSTSASSPLVLWGRDVLPLDSLLFEALGREDYPPSQCRLLTCLAILRTAAASASAASGTGSASGETFSGAVSAKGAEDTGRTVNSPNWSAQWLLLSKLFAGHVGSANSDVPARSLALMGSLLYEHSSLSSGDASAAADVSAQHYATWLAHLKFAAQPHLKPCMRLAAVHSILASNCLAMPLDNSTFVGSGVVLGAWFVCFMLALDDDEEVRDAAAQALTAHSSSGVDVVKGTTQSLLLDTRPCNARALEVAMDALTKKVLVAALAQKDHTVDLIGDYAGHLEGFWRSATPSFSLLAPIGGKDEDAGEDSGGASSSARAIFEVEEDNLYSEPVLVAQLAARQLAVLFSAANNEASGLSPSSASSASSSSKLAAVARTLEVSLVEALQSMLRDAQGGSGSGGSATGVTPGGDEGGNASLLDGRASGFQAKYVALAALGCGPTLVRSSTALALAAELLALPNFSAPSVVHPVLRTAIEAAYMPRSSSTGPSTPSNQAAGMYYFLAAPPATV